MHSTNRYSHITLVSRAVNLAFIAHFGQTRKGTGLPYIIHPMDVMTFLADSGVEDEITLASSVTHDVGEDCPQVSEGYFLDATSQEVYNVVYKELTFAPSFQKERNGISTVTQKAEYMTTFDKKSVVALTIKVVDRCKNSKDFYLEDVKLSKKAYCKVYFNKAASLFTTWDARKLEVIDFYGIATHKKINELIEKTRADCDSLANFTG